MKKLEETRIKEKEMKKLKDKSFTSIVDYLERQAYIGEFEIGGDKADMYAKELRDRYSQSCMLNENLIKEITKLKKHIKKYESS